MLRAPLILLTTLAVLASPAWGQDQPPLRAIRREVRPSLAVALAFEQLYDDNILRLTQHDLDRFAANPAPPRFLISTPDDNISSLETDLRWYLRPLPRRETRLAAFIDIHKYQRNEVKDWQHYGISLLQELTASKRHLASLQLWYDFEPEYYLRQITDADASFAAGQRIRRSLRYSQAAFGGRWNQVVIRGRCDFSVGFERIRRNYDSYFDERDDDNDEWQFEIQMRPFAQWGLEVGLGYVAGTLDARGDLPTTPIRDTDISYEHHGPQASLALPWGHGARRGHVRVAWVPERRAFTTQDKYDVTRFGRINHRREIDVDITQSIWGPLDLSASFSRLASEASFPTGIDFAEDETDFRQTRFGLALRSRWTLLSR